MTEVTGRRRNVLLVALATVVVLTVAALSLVGLLGRDARRSASPTSSPSVTPLPAGPSGTPSASVAPGLTPGDYTHSVTVDGRARTFILHVPPAETTGQALPLVFVYHGALDTAANTQASTDFDKVADSRGILVAFMQGYQNTWNEGAGHTPAEVAGVDDVAFTRAALEAIEEQVAVDPARVAAAGFSNGALLADLLGCRLAGSIRLIVPVAGPLPVTVSPGCQPSQPVSVLEIHGTADDTIPYNGGPFDGVGGGTSVLSAPAAVARWASLDRCTGLPTTQNSASLRLATYRGCTDDVKVSLHTLVGAGHDWPADIGETVASALGLTS